MNKKVKKGIISLMVGLTVLYSVSISQVQFADAAEQGGPQATKVVYLDGKGGSDDNSGDSETTAVKSFAMAKKLAEAGGTIKVKAFAETTDIIIDNGIKVELTDNITLDGGGVQGKNGIVVGSDSKLTAPGKTLTMKNYNTNENTGELVVKNGGTLGDGTYNLTSGDGGQAFMSINGKVEGTSRDALVLNSDAGYAPNFIRSSGGTFANCTATIISRSNDRIGSGFGGLFGAWVDTGNGHLHLDNVDMTVQGIGGGFYLTPDFNNSTFTVANAPGGKSIKTGATWSGKGEIVNSTVNVNAGWVAGISVGDGGDVDVKNSTIVFDNNTYSFAGGLNVATGTVNIIDSKLLAGKKNPPSVMMGTGTEGRGHLKIDGKSYVSAPLLAGGSINGGNPVVVDGGLFNIDPAKNIITTEANSIPVNSENTPLNLVELTNYPAGFAMDLGSYTYDVPEEDGAKFLCVWVPTKKVTFDLNNSSAAYEGGTKENKVLGAVVNQPLSLVKSVNGNAQAYPQNPVAAGYKFLGWFAQDGSEFTPDTNVTGDMTVKAKWAVDPSVYSVAYHKNTGGNGPVYIKEGSNPQRRAKVLSFDDVVKAEPKFADSDLKFVAWNTKADGSGKSYKADEVIDLPKDVGSISLYAQYETIPVTLKFDAKGGNFAKDSIFLNDKVFTLEKDEATGDLVAVLKTEKGKTLLQALQEKDPSIKSLPMGLSPSSDFPQNFIAPQYHYMPVSYVVSFWFFTENNYAWYLDGQPAKNLNGSMVLNESQTYYLNWQLRPNVHFVNSKDMTLDGDILVGEDTEHDSYYKVETGDEMTYTARLNVEPIKLKMGELEKMYNINGGEVINVKEMESSFVAKFKVGEGLRVDTSKLKAVLDNNPLFEVKAGSVTYDDTDKTITVPMTLKSKFTDYFALKKAVFATGGDSSLLNLKVSGVKVVATEGTQTVIGTVEGTFHGVAQKVPDINTSTEMRRKPRMKRGVVDAADENLETVVFDFQWHGIQQKNPNGQDFRLRNTPESQEISFTSELPETTRVTEPPTTVDKPETPKKPDKPQKPEAPKEKVEAEKVTTGDRGFGGYGLLLLISTALTVAVVLRKKLN